ncbi:hypothetical protein BGX31_004839, partial [Mortierella sp. GBA43]
NVVYHLEKFITRCVPEYKLTGLYVLDSICRTSQNVKAKSSSGSFSGSEYVGRFEKNIEALFAEFCKVQEDKEKEKVKRVVDLWERSGTFSATVIENIKKKHFPLLETSPDHSAGATSANGPSTSMSTLVAPTAVDDNAVDAAASLISSLAASFGAAPGPGNASLMTTSSPFNFAGGPTSIPPINGTPSQIESEKSNPATLMDRSSAPVSAPDGAIPLLNGIADPSSALALQTLLATVSQVKAAAEAAVSGVTGPGPGPGPPGVGAGAGTGNLFHGYPTGPSGPMPVPPPFPPSLPGLGLPPVLQQLQGVLSNSNQNGAFLPNNNTVVSSTVASSVLQTSGGGSSSNEGNGGGMNGGPGPGLRDPRIDPRVDPRVDPRLDPREDPRLANHRQNGQDSGLQAQQQAQQGKQHQAQHAQPLAPPHNQGAMFGTAGGAHPPGLLPPGAAALAGSTSHPPGFLGPGPGFDGETMARLASLLNHPNDASKPTLPGSFPAGPVPFPGPPMTRGQQDSMGQGQGQGPGPGSTEDNSNNHNNNNNSNPRRAHPSLPNRPRTAQDSFHQRQGSDMSMNGGGGGGGGYPQGMDDKLSNTRDPPVVIEDPTVGSDKIRVISRTLWVGGNFVPTIPEQELEDLFSVKGKISTIMVNPSKFNAFIKMADRPIAERCKVELDRTSVHGELMKVGWGCGFGPRDCFDYTAGTSLIPLDRLTDTDRRWLGNSVVGGFGTREFIRGGVVILEPNIEPVSVDGREALPRKSRNPGAAGGGGGGGAGGGGAGAAPGGSRGGRGGGVNANGPGGRGRGRGGSDQQDTAGGPRGRGTGSGRGRGLDEHAEHQQQQQQHWSHPLPLRPQTTPIGFQGQQQGQMGSGAGGGPGAGGWGGKRDFQEQEQNAGGGGFQAHNQGQGQGQQEDETRRKKSRWE